MDLENTHYKLYPYTLNMVHDKDGYALAVMERNHYVDAVFDINFCPLCGRRLTDMICKDCADDNTDTCIACHREQRYRKREDA
jgi:hypothetical protein